MTPDSPDNSRAGNDNRVAEDDLQAYVDGQLDVRRRAAIEGYLAAHPDEAARLAAFREQNIGLHALFDPRPGSRHDDGLPPRIVALAAALDATLSAGAASRPAIRRPWRRLAASIAVLLTAGTAGWIALERGAWQHDSLVTLTRQAAEAPLQPAANASGTEPAGGERQVVAWLAAQTGDGPARVPDLEALGFRLAGERMLATTGGPAAAQLLYQDDAGERVTLTMRPGGKAGQTSFTFARDGEAARFVWQDAHMAYSLAGNMAQEKLLKIAEAVSQSLRESEMPAAPQQAVQPAAGAESPAAAPSAPAAPSDGAAPLLDKSPLIPAPLPDTGAPKET